MAYCMDWNAFSAKAVRGENLSVEEAQAVLSCPEDSLLALLDSAFEVRRKFFGRRVKLNYLLNARSGLCPEDCSYCSQSSISKAPIEKYPLLSEGEILLAASRAVSLRARRFCMVSSGRAATDGEIEQVSLAVKKVRGEFPQLEVCVCMGLLNLEQAEELKNCGVHAYNHNLNTSPGHYTEICSTHTYQDRLKTVRVVKESGLSPCSGCLFGMGEKDRDILEIAFALRENQVDSIPINFLIPIGGTPLAGKQELNPQRCLKILCLFRFLNPRSEIRIAGGREVHLRWLQPLGLYAANSIFIGDYLTTKGQKPEADLAMIRDLGFEVEGEDGSKARTDPASLDEDFTVRLKA